MRLAERGLEVLDLIQQRPLGSVRAGLPAASIAAAPPSRNCRFQFPIVVSDTFDRRAASAPLSSPAKIDNTIRTFSCTGIAGGRDMIRLLRLRITIDPCQEP
jgi:hypothetical protein